MHPVERYLTELLHLHRLQAGTGELSAYPPLLALLTEIGRGLKPRIAALLLLQPRLDDNYQAVKGETYNV